MSELSPEEHRWLMASDEELFSEIGKLDCAEHPALVMLVEKYKAKRGSLNCIWASLKTWRSRYFKAAGREEPDWSNDDEVVKYYNGK